MNLQIKSNTPRCPLSFIFLILLITSYSHTPSQENTKHFLSSFSLYKPYIFPPTTSIMNSETHKKPHKPLNFLTTTLNSTQTCNILSSHPYLSLFIALLFLQLLIISITPTSNAVVSTDDHCPSGKVYVYDLPSKFNTDLLLRNCTDLNPWNWQCGLVSNHGYGLPASDLRHVLPENLYTSWYRTNQFSLELIFHHRVLSHECRTMEPGSATSFYIPFYAGLAVGKYLWTNDTSERDHLCEEMLTWIINQEYWKRSNGSDHILTIGRITWDFRRLTDPDKKWGSTFLNMADMQNVNRFIIEKAPWDPRDISVPYPTGFHPKDKHTVHRWQSFARDYNRSKLFTFIGATRGWVSNDFRGLLLNYCRSEPGSCRLIDCAAAQCATDTWVVLEALLGSEFCLQPRGDSFTRRSVFDCMVAGSVPVFFWNRTAYEQYERFLPGEPESYSVFIDHEEVRSVGSGVIKRVLMGFSDEEIKRKRERVIETIPRIVYGMGNIKGFKDGFDVAFDGVLERIKDDKILE